MHGLLYGAVVVIGFYFYATSNDRKLSQFPPAARVFSPDRFTAQDVRATFKQQQDAPIDIGGLLPPRTGRRYIVIGGAGFLGGWIVLHLLQRGEDPRRIRVLDLRLPTRPDLRTGDAQQVAFFQVDISDAKAVSDAFRAPWPETDTRFDDDGITVFHSAASIRFFERISAFFSRSTKVNYEGTKNIVAASKDVGADVLVYTSSGAVGVRRTGFWLWPWETQPQFWVQVVNDDDSLIPTRRDLFFSNYAASKRLGEVVICEADRSPSGRSRTLRTGCIRPGNGIYGPGGDLLCGSYLVQKHNPTWVKNILQSYIYVENCALAHLCYEQRLLELERGGRNPDIGGQAFIVTDKGRPCTYGDLQLTLSTLDEECKFPIYSFTFILSVAHIIEALYVSKALLAQSNSVLGRALSRMIPSVRGELANLQPSMFALVGVHLICDDSRARLSPSEGGLGYNPPYTTLQGICKTADVHFKTSGAGKESSQSNGDNLNSHNLESSRAVGKGDDKQHRVEAVTVLN